MVYDHLFMSPIAVFSSFFSQLGSLLRYQAEALADAARTPLRSPVHLISGLATGPQDTVGAAWDVRVPETYFPYLSLSFRIWLYASVQGCALLVTFILVRSSWGCLTT
jgi:hypothetical protein